VSLDTLVPAYTVTIHKSQGSEYPAVVIPVLTQLTPCCSVIPGVVRWSEGGWSYPPDGGSGHDLSPFGHPAGIAGDHSSGHAWFIDHADFEITVEGRSGDGLPLGHWGKTITFGQSAGIFLKRTALPKFPLQSKVGGAVIWGRAVASRLANRPAPERWTLPCGSTVWVPRPPSSSVRSVKD
jgi:UvrD-like helicase C-terminal domain